MTPSAQGVGKATRGNKKFMVKLKRYKLNSVYYELRNIGYKLKIDNMS